MSGIRSPNIPAGTGISEFIGHELVGGVSSLRRFSRDDVLGPIESMRGEISLSYATLALLNGDLAHGAHSVAMVYNDTTAANNGIYEKIGVSGVGSWTRTGDLPGNIVVLHVTGGTGDAIVATAIENPQAPGSKLFLLVPNLPNTTVTTIDINSVGPVEIKNSSGVSLAEGSLLAGSPVLMIKTSSYYQLVVSTNVDASAIFAAAQSAATSAATSASAAASSAASLAGVVGMAPPGGRPTLTSGVAVTTSDVAGAPVVYYTPSLSEYIRVFDGTNDVLILFAELPLFLDATSGHTGYHQSGKNFDLFVAVSSGNKLGTGPAWSSDTARGTGAGTTEIEFYRGLWRNKNAITLRFGSASGNTVSIPARQATYVGSFRATADGQASDTVLKRFLFSAYNPVPRTMAVNAEALGTTWIYSTQTWRQVNANANNKVEYLQGLPNGPVKARAVGTSAVAGGNILTFTGVGVNSIAINSAKGGLIPPADATIVSQGEANYSGYASLGYSYLAWLESSVAGSTTTWYSGDATSSLFSSGLQAEVWG